MVKVLIVSGSLPPIRCGVGYYTDRLSLELNKAGVDFELLSTKGVDKPAAAPLRVVPNWKIASLPRMLAAVKASRANIVHIEYPAVGYRRQLGINLLPYFLRLFRPGVKVLITLHEYHQSRLIGRLRNRITIWPADKVIVSNQPDVRGLKRLSKKIRVVPIGANFDVAPKRRDLFEKVLKSHGLDPKAETLVFFGYAFPAKKLEVLLDALEKPQLQGYQLLIFPEIDSRSGYHQKLRNKVKELNSVRPRVGVHKFLDGPDASAVLQEGKYFVLPNSRPLTAKSGTAIAAIENGLVLISRGSENPDDSAPFEHLKNCLLLDEVSPESIAAAIGRLDDDPAALRTIREGAAELKKYFSWANIAKRHIKIYKELSGA